MERSGAFRGSLLALAVGDAMGYAVDNRTMEQIRRDYGPDGLMGYDLANGYADVTSYTQLAVFTANALLVQQTRQQLTDKAASPIRYIALGLQEWAASQRRFNLPERTCCWAYKVKELCRRRCMDTWMLNSLDKGKLGTFNEPVNNYPSPCSLTMAAAVGIFSAGDAAKLSPIEADVLGAQAVALLYGSPISFLSGAIVTRILRTLLTDGETSLKMVFAKAVAEVEKAWEKRFPEAMRAVAITVRQGIYRAEENTPPSQVMESLRCSDAHEVLAGALYAALTHEQDFDGAMICAVNHSGHSAGVAALTGAFLGARMGDEALPDFYLDCLDVAPMLKVLAYDLRQGCPMDRHNRLYDMDWDRKYRHGEY